MADIKKAMPLLYEAEFNNIPERFLHKNPTEDGLTIGGVYQKANPYGIDWKLISTIHEATGAITRASRMLFVDKEIQHQVSIVFKEKYWDKMKLDQVKSQKIANEIFLMGVVAGISTSAKIAQGILGINKDGIIGSQSIKYLNLFDDKAFDVEFDKREIKHFEKLARDNEKYKIYLKGWRKRARLV